MKPILAIIDGDLFAYKYAAAGQKEFDWGDGTTSLHSDPTTVFRNVENDIRHCALALKAEKIVVCLSDDRSFRKEQVYPEYKSNRKNVRKPVALPEVKRLMFETFEVKTKSLLEADDVMGIIATNPLLYPEYDKVICSRDKDMKTIPTAVWDESMDGRKPNIAYITEEEADLRHLVQTLTGDPADGYPGCKGIGPARAARIATGGWASVAATFEERGHTKDFALSMARCARILRATDYDYTTQQPKLWTPN